MRKTIMKLLSLHIRNSLAVMIRDPRHVDQPLPLFNVNIAHAFPSSHDFGGDGFLANLPAIWIYSFLWMQTNTFVSVTSAGGPALPTQLFGLAACLSQVTSSFLPTTSPTRFGRHFFYSMDAVQLLSAAWLGAASSPQLFGPAACLCQPHPSSLYTTHNRIRHLPLSNFKAKPQVQNTFKN